MDTLVLTYDFKCVFDSLPCGEKQWWIGLLLRFITTESTLQVLNYVISNNKNWYPAKFVKFQPCLIIQCRFSSNGFLPPSFFNVTFDHLWKFKARVPGTVPCKEKVIMIQKTCVDFALGFNMPSQQYQENHNFHSLESHLQPPSLSYGLVNMSSSTKVSSLLGSLVWTRLNALQQSLPDRIQFPQCTT